MELNEKLQELRKKKGLTQEELAQALYVSRTAISKWESGRGYPNLDSLKGISKFFGVTVDELLSGDELLTLAQEDTKQKEKHFRDVVFGMLDCAAAMLLFLPFFGQKANGSIQEVSLLALEGGSTYLRAGYFVLVIGMVLTGIATLALQNGHWSIWVKNKGKLSVILNALAVLLFVVSLQPYGAVFLFVFLLIKLMMLIKWQ